MGERKLSLRSEGGKALVQLTRDQFSFWEQELSKVATKLNSEGMKVEFKPSNAMHYWHILSTLAGDGDVEFKVEKKTVHCCLPQLSEESGRKHLAECEKLGLTRVITDKGKRYAAMTETGHGVLAATLGRWILEFGKIQAKYFKNGG